MSSLDTTEPLLPPDVPTETASSEVVHSLLRLLEIAQYRRKTILQAVCVAAILGAVYYALAPRYYDATAKLLIVYRNQDQVASVADQPALDSTMATHREIVVSPVVIQEAIENLLPEHRVDFQDAPPSEWNRILADRLQARTTRKANFIEVRFRSLSPEAGAAVVSAVIQAYLGFVDRTHKGSAGEAIAVWTQKSDQVAAALAVKKNELQACRDRMGSLTVSTDGSIVEPSVQRALKLNEALMAAQERRLKLEASLGAVQQAIHNGEDLHHYVVSLEETVGQQMLSSALGVSPQDLRLLADQEQKLLDAQAELERIAPFCGPEHPRVKDLQNRVQTIEHYLASYRSGANDRMRAGGGNFGPLLLGMLEKSVAQARHQEHQLQLAFDAQRQQARAQSDDLQQVQDIEREVARLEMEYDSLITKITTVDTYQLQAPIQATVVQEPLPEEMAASPQLRLVGLMALLGGLLVGGGIAYVQDVLDDRFASPEQMSAQLGVPVLSMVRRLEPLEGQGLATVHTFVAPNAVQSETFRTLRTALTLSSGATERIAISSAEPGDGKTTIAANLATSFAQAGKKTLIIDADLRKPGMTALLCLKGQPGVADVLMGAAGAGLGARGAETVESAAARLVRHTDLPGLDVLPAGLRRSNPAELLSSQNFVELLAWAEANYDQILVDCPPVLAVSDAQIVGRLVDGAILVVQPQKNHRRLVARAVHSFAATGTTVLGIVANGLSDDRSRGYGYGYGYGYGDGYGYGHDGESDAPPEDDGERQNVRSRAA